MRLAPAGGGDDVAPLRRRLAAEDGEPVVAQPPHHVHVDHRFEVADGDPRRRLAGEVGRSQDPRLLAREGHEVDVAPQLAAARRQRARRRQHGGGAGGVVVGAVVGFVGLGGEGVGAAEPEVIVMGADQDGAGVMRVAGGAGGEPADDVVGRRGGEVEPHVEAHAMGAGEEALAHRPLHRRHRDAGVALALDVERRQRRLLGRRLPRRHQRQVDDDQPHRPVLAGVPGLVAEVAVAALGVALGEAGGRDEAADEGHLAGGVDPGVVVDPEIGGGDPVAGGHQLGVGGDGGRGGEGGGAEVVGRRRARRRSPARCPPPPPPRSARRSAGGSRAGRRGAGRRRARGRWRRSARRARRRTRRGRRCPGRGRRGRRRPARRRRRDSGRPPAPRPAAPPPASRRRRRWSRRACPDCGWRRRRGGCRRARRSGSRRSRASG